MVFQIILLSRGKGCIQYGLNKKKSSGEGGEFVVRVSQWANDYGVFRAGNSFRGQ